MATKATVNTLLDRAVIAIGDARDALKDLAMPGTPGTPGAPGAPVAPPEAAPRAILTIGSASAQSGKEARVEVRVTCPEPLAGIWFNIRHSPRLAFVSASAKVKSRAFRVNKLEDHFRAVLMFSSDLETESAIPGEGVVQLDPETLVLEATYRLPANATPGQRFAVQAGFSGVQGAGTGGPSASFPTLLLTWKSGGIAPLVVDGYIEVAP
jgi:hypothetical protein